jgi:hypothetical protein
MSKEYGISREDEAEPGARDRACVHCWKVMKSYAEIQAGRGTVADQASIEHLNFDGPFYVRDGLRKEDIVMCCRGCNSSRGEKKLLEWFRSDYCVSRKINEETVAQVVKEYLRRVVRGG